MASATTQACRNCKAALPDGAKFCPACGTAALPGCTACKAMLEPSDRFCRNCGTPVPQAAPDPVSAEDGEHRQITVLFCDVVGSTKLSLEADIEDLREVLRRYQKVCATAVERHSGMIAQYLGDGVVAYFGYPLSAEDAPVWACDAALEITRSVDDLNGDIGRRLGIRIAVRVGLHTGRVLIGEMGAGRTRAENAVTGAVPNVASRIESCAPENGIAVSDVLRQRTRHAFEFTSLGAHELKGVAEPMQVFQLVSRIQASKTVLTQAEVPPVGREEELATLDALWRKTVDGGRPVFVTVTGEPGIGKSALITQFLADTGIGGDDLIVFTGTTAERNAPFSSFLRMLEGELELPPGKFSAEADARIRDWFARHGCNDTLAADAMIDLRRANHVRDDEADGDGAARAEAFAAFRTFLLERPGPVLIVAEDAHWVDPSTLAMIDEAARPDAATPVMVLTVSRPQTGFPWTDRTLRTIELPGLDAASCATVIGRVAGVDRVEPALVTDILEISNGVPLFAEELARVMLGRGHLAVVRGQLRMVSPGEATTPPTLMDLLMARLDGLGEAKALAQIASVLGRVVSTAALAAVARLSAEDFSQALNTLVAAEVIRTTRRPGIVQFRHTLFQKAAYETLLRRRRETVHGAYVDWLSNHATGDGIAPQELGYHCFGAGRFADAATHYHAAGLIASRASAGREAAAHFARALEALERAPTGAAPPAMKLELKVRRAGALLSFEGAGATVTGDAYEDAIETSRRTPHSRWHFPAYWGWWRISSNFPEMTARALRIVDAADNTDDPEFKLQAHHCMWANTFQIGALGEVLEHARTGLVHYDVRRSLETGVLFGGHDAKVCGHGQSALTHWLKGAGDSCRAGMDAALAHAETLDHRGSLLHALDIAATLHCHRRDAAATRKMAGRLIALGETAGIDEYLGKGRFFRGWAAAHEGEIADGLAEMEAAFAILEVSATNEDFPLFQCLMAEAMRRQGDCDAARAALDAARAVIESEGVTYWEAEVAREAAAIEAAGDGDRDRIAALLARSDEIAESQGALALQLRTAVTRAELSGASPEDLAAIQALLDTLPPGADGVDIARARAVAARQSA